MKLYSYFLIAIILISSCKEDQDLPVLPENYGEGMYILTDNGISFYNNQNPSSEIENNIYTTVNNTSINNAKKIKFNNNQAYILAQDYITIVDIKTFAESGTIVGFSNPVDFDFISPNQRLFVVDKDDSRVKVADVGRLEITSDIETGDSTKPIFIISNSYKSFILNGGGSEKKDSTAVVIQYKDNLVALTNFEANLILGDNPNSAVITNTGALKVLCKGVYNPNNPINNTESSISNINQYSNEVYSTNNLSGIYNAQNLIGNFDNSLCYFTALGGVYSLNPTTLNINQILNINSSVINTNVESIDINDSTTVYYEMLYINDDNTPNTIYKYNIALSAFTDTIICNGTIRDINFY